MDRTIRIPDHLVDHLLTGIDACWRNHLSVGPPLVIARRHFYFPIFLKMTDQMEYVPLLNMANHFTAHGALCYDMTATHYASLTAVTFFVKARKSLGKPPTASALAQPDAPRQSE
jgi:hypothetical protein